MNVASDNPLEGITPSEPFPYAWVVCAAVVGITVIVVIIVGLQRRSLMKIQPPLPDDVGDLPPGVFMALFSAKAGPIEIRRGNHSENVDLPVNGRRRRRRTAAHVLNAAGWAAAGPALQIAAATYAFPVKRTAKQFR